jgi:hypothetical protein
MSVSHVRIFGVALCLACAALATACNGKPDSETRQSAASPISRTVPSDAPTPDVWVADAQLVTVQTASIAVATFRGEHLQGCLQVVVTVTRANDFAVAPAYNVTPEQAAMLMLDDALIAFANPKDGKSTFVGARQIMARILLTLTTGRPIPLNSAAAAKVIKELTVGARWPPKDREEQVKSGELARVESCAFPDRTPLGACAIESTATGSTPGPADPEAKLHFDVAPASELALRVDRYHFDVASTSDSDAGMKTCLALGGKWSAPSRSDPATARERARQHAGQLRELYGR